MENYGKKYESLNNGQREAFHIVVDGKNLFLTGDAGTGKSYLTEVISEYFLRNGKTLIKAAPTGTAANNIGGVTLHHQFGLKVGLDLNPVKGLTKKQKVLLSCDGLLIDEISMTRIDVFDKLMGIVQTANNERARQGKPPLQLILVGDFSQLPPVLRRDEAPFLTQHYGKSVHKGFAFQSKFWRIFDIQYYRLKDIIRQKDAAFCKALDMCKAGNPSCIPYIEEHSAKEPSPDAIWVCGKNQTADEKNRAELDKLPGKMYVVKTAYSGKATKEDKLCSDSFAFKVGAKVVMLINDNKDHMYQNGSIGYVVDFDGYGNIRVRFGQKSTWVALHKFPKTEYVQEDVPPPPAELVSVIADTVNSDHKPYSHKENEKWLTVCRAEADEPLKFELYAKRQSGSKKLVSVTAGGKGFALEYVSDVPLSDADKAITEMAFLEAGVKITGGKLKKGKGKVLKQNEIGYAMQFPMRLGYAVTVHKSQGQTYDAMNLITSTENGSEIFECGQLYVALSRCKTIENLYVQGHIYDDMVIASEEVLRFYASPETYSYFDEADIMQNISIPKKYVKRVKEMIAKWEAVDKGIVPAAEAGGYAELMPDGNIRETPERNIGFDASKAAKPSVSKPVSPEEVKSIWGAFNKAKNAGNETASKADITTPFVQTAVSSESLKSDKFDIIDDGEVPF